MNNPVNPKFIDVLQIGLFDLSADGKLLYIDAKFSGLWGLDTNEKVPASVYEMLSEGEADYLIGEMKRKEVIRVRSTFSLNGKNIEAFVVGMPLDENRYNFLFIPANQWYDQRVLKDKNGFFNSSGMNDNLMFELTGMKEKLKQLMSYNEILASKIVEQELVDKKIFTHINEGIWEYEFKTKKFSFNDRFLEILGYEAFEFEQDIATLHKLLHEEDKERIIKAIEYTGPDASNFILECRLRNQKGIYQWVQINAMLDEGFEDANSRKWLGTVADIDIRKSYEEQIRQNEQILAEQSESFEKVNSQLEISLKKINKLYTQLQEKQKLLDNILNSVPAFIGLVSDNIILFANEHASLMTGYNMEEISGRNFSFLFADEDEYLNVNKILSTYLVEQNTSTVNTHWRMKNGVRLDVMITAANLELSGSNSFSFVAFDITSQRIYEEELIAAKEKSEVAERLKSVFLCNISHELRTPANGIIGFAELLKNCRDDEKRAQYIQIIINSSKQLVKIVSDLVDVSKIEIGEIELFSNIVELPKLMGELFEYFKNYMLIRGKTQIELVLEPLDALLKEPVVTDEPKLRLIMQNLLSNAVKFTDNGQIRFGCSKREDYLEFFVSDTGIGIAEEEKELIFEAFKQVEMSSKRLYGGNGLGLAIAKGYVKAMGGTIWVESKKGGGSKFSFIIPYNVKSQVIIKADNGASFKWEDKHILLVEDDITSAMLIKALLEDFPVKITHVVTGIEAVKACKKDESIDLVLMDMRLPEMDGFEATRLIKQYNPQMPVIAQTAHAFSEDKGKCMAAGCDGYLTKPMQQEDLINAILKCWQVS
ncbi:MAG TPA: ATP-binding protein [Bacteroidales bacterium]|nr:ATP-binding protein [Bacteroidales bacterium]